VSESPSASVALAAQVRVLDAVGLAGVTATLLMTGAVFATVTLSLTAVPVSVPSVGSTWHATLSPPLKPLDRVLPEPAVLPLMDHT
jgi:hypothetical protein